MQHVGEIASLPTRNSADRKPQSSSETSGWSVKAELATALATVWAEMSGMWPRLWRDKHGPVRHADGQLGEGFKTWLRTLKGLTPDQVAHGLERVRDSGAKYPPDPVEYRALCFRSARELGLPEAREAYLLVSRRAWDHPVIWVAAQEGVKRGCGSWDIRNRQERETWPLFQKLYQELVERADAGEEFRIRRQEAPAISHEPVAAAGTEYGSAEEARAEMLRRFGRQRVQ